MRRALAIASVAALTGCVLLVDATDYGTTCHFSGDATSACGLCIAAACSAAVNACCAVGACAPTLGDLDACGGGKGCSALLGATSSSVTERSALAGCVKSSCGTVCSLAATDAGAGGDAANAATACNGSASACSCVGTPGPGSNTATCGPSTLKVSPLDVMCCADESYPAGVASQCSCTVIRCDNSRLDSCSCGSGASYSKLGLACSKGSPSYEWACCQSDNSFGAYQCYCVHNTNIPSCKSSETDMGAECSASAMNCGQSKKRVSACK